MKSESLTLGTEPETGVAILTGGADQPYAFGLSTALMSKGVRLDVIAGDELDGPVFHGNPLVRFLNLRGDTSPGVSAATKIARVLVYYVRLLRYALTAKPKIFHILWNNKFEMFDRTVLMLYYRLLKKRLVLTVHNVNAGIRDGSDSWLNRFTLRVQYRLADQIFVHTDRMKTELVRDFGVRDEAVNVIPFGINNATPVTDITGDEARDRLGVQRSARVLLFFGNIIPYKGLEYLVAAFERLAIARPDYRLIIAGRPRGAQDYWSGIEQKIARDIEPGRVVQKIEFVPDSETELYFKAADALVLPYTEIFQSGVLFLGYSFGLPVLAADVGSMREDIVEGETGFVFEKQDAVDLARAVDRYFSSDLYRSLSARRKVIQDYANERHSWEKVSLITRGVYRKVLGSPKRADALIEGDAPAGQR
jgi:glycosyltransferase involved in cell wall biosynthesis